MNLLPYSPVPPFFGGAMRIYHLLKHMLDIGEVSVLLYGDDGDRDRIQTAFEGRVQQIMVVPPPIPWKGVRRRFIQLGAYLRGRSAGYAYSHSPALQREIERTLSRTGFDIILSETHLMSLVDLSKSDAVRILDAHNVEHDGFTRLARNSRSMMRRAFYKHEAKACFREETEAWRNQDAILCTSQRDRTILEVHAPSIP
ncbi:MAG: hypothetical protein OEM41_09715, partial [Ignavibacteria bacterium]|nr:hypothetical protein [Ignavibacteria bacterium]